MGGGVIYYLFIFPYFAFIYFIFIYYLITIISHIFISLLFISYLFIFGSFITPFSFFGTVDTFARVPRNMSARFIYIFMIII